MTTKRESKTEITNNHLPALLTKNNDQTFPHLISIDSNVTVQKSGRQAFSCTVSRTTSWEHTHSNAQSLTQQLLDL